MELEKLKLQEIPQVYEIERLSFPDPHTISMITASVMNPACEFWVGKVGGKIVGFVEFWVMYEESHVIDIAVHPDFRSKGYGKTLMKHLIERSKALGAKKIFLEVRPSNTIAINLYKKFGFSESGIRKMYYKNEDALIMEKTIQ